MNYLKQYIEALDAEKEGDWELAHQIVQEIKTPEAAWIHAYLHRVEGDLGNADYWYRHAGKPPCRTALELERDELYATFS